MPLTPRFFFHGEAAALSGRIYRPDAYDIEVAGASALTVAGGVSRADIAGRTIGTVSFKRASTLAEGRFTDDQDAVRLTHHEVLEWDLRTTTIVSAEVEALEVSGGRFRAGLVRGALTGQSPRTADEPPIQLDRASDILDVVVEGTGVKVDIDRDLFETYDTRAKLVAACEDSKFVEQHAAALLVGAQRYGSVPGGRPRLFCGETQYATIVRKLRWTGPEPQTARIEDHTIVVEDFGTIFFGEILVSRSSRRLTMLRFELGSTVGGRFAAATIGANGSWVP